jgi:hypothetical protein
MISSESYCMPDYRAGMKSLEMEMKLYRNKKLQQYP